MGWRIRGSSTCPRGPGEKCRAIIRLRLHQFMRAVVVVLVVSVIILIHFVVVIFSLRMHAQQMFPALFTGVLNTIACICWRGVSRVFPAGLRLAFVSKCEGFVWVWEVSPYFLQGVDVYVLCVCVYAHALTLHVGYSDVSPGVGTKHLETPEEIQMY